MLTEFCRFLGVMVDPKKTFTWSISASDRKLLRSQGALVERAKKDEGAHMQFNAQQTNASVIAKLKDLDQLWPSLAQSKAPLSHKQRILTTVAWPRAFYAASTVHISETHITALRRGAMKSLMLDKQGANPMIQLSLTGDPLQDPGFFVLWDSVMQLRRHGCPEETAVVLDSTAWVPNRQKKPGPVGVLAARLSNIGMPYHAGTSFLDHDAVPCDIFALPVQELKQRLKRAWCRTVGHQVEHRHDFAGIHRVDTSTSNREFPDMTAEECGLLRALKNGTAITNNLLYASGQSDTKTCRFCGLSDSLVHRHWECEATEHLRKMLPPDILTEIPSLPECTQARGWFVEPSSVTDFKLSLSLIPDSIHAHEVPAFAWDTNVLDLFTDGTGVGPTVPAVRLVAWAVVCSDSSAFPVQRAQPVAQGGVPGQWQTVLRAEATALLAAISFASRLGKPCRIWCDNDLVVKRCRKIQRGQFRITRLITDHDLWEQLAEMLRRCPCSVEIIKVASHQTVENASDLEAWVFAGNDAADRAARHAMQCLPSSVLQSQARATRDTKHTRYLQQHCHKHFARVGTFAVHHVKPDIDEVPREPAMLTADDQIVDFSAIARVAHNSDAKLQFPGFGKFVSWLHHLAANTAGQTVQWVTWYELLFSFQMGTGFRSLTKIHSQGKWKPTDLHSDYKLQPECHAFSPYVQLFIRQVYPDWSVSHVKPSFHKFQKWAMCLATRINPAEAMKVHDWMITELGDRQVVNLARDLGMLPMATTDAAAIPPCGGLFKYFR
eukprot:Skav232514  [mRNA]  locus=scaffold1096:710531:712861:+ [translate_table: standard]